MNEQSTGVKKSWPYILFTNLTFYVLIAIIAGVLLGHYFPATAIKTEWIGKTFVDIIKLFIAPIIFLTIVLGISSIGNLKKVGRIGIKSLIYFEIVTTLALGIGIVVALIVQPGNIDRTGLQLQDTCKVRLDLKNADQLKLLPA